MFLWRWKKTEKKKPKRVDYVLISDGVKVALAIYNPKYDEFVNITIGSNSSCEPKYWEYVPLAYEYQLYTKFYPFKVNK